jgi:molecular chaperone DnaK (HSP70)
MKQKQFSFITYQITVGLMNQKQHSDSETILVFDMGGATINATVVTANKTLDKRQT